MWGRGAPKCTRTPNAPQILWHFGSRSIIQYFYCINVAVVVLEIGSIEIAQLGNQVNKHLLTLAIRAISALVSRVSLATAR